MGLETTHRVSRWVEMCPGLGSVRIQGGLEKWVWITSRLCRLLRPNTECSEGRDIRRVLSKSSSAASRRGRLESWHSCHGGHGGKQGRRHAPDIADSAGAFRSHASGLGFPGLLAGNMKTSVLRSRGKTADHGSWLAVGSLKVLRSSREGGVLAAREADKDQEGPGDLHEKEAYLIQHGSGSPPSVWFNKW